MKVLILSTFRNSGGAAIAAGRLLHALNSNGVEATMLCRRNIGFGPKRLRKQSWCSIWERLAIWKNNGFSAKNLWATDIANCGQDITDTKEFKEADVIHLHWINQGFISLGTLEKIVNSGKRIVWTMHDEWPLESIYHYTYGDEVQSSSYVSNVYKRKREIYSKGNITFVTCSEWLGRIAKSKSLGKEQDIVSIPNPIDTSIFRPNKHDNQRRVLFVAQNVDDERKGIRYLDEAAKYLGGDIEVVALGRDIPYISDVYEMAELYASFDAFVTPSLQDNLPNTIMEAMSCGTPCVGFNVGGIPEMIDHKLNGYVAEYKNARDLAEGIKYVLDDANHGRLSSACIEKVNRCYSENSVAERYINVYNNRK